MIWLQTFLWVVCGIYALGFAVTFCFTFYVTCALTSMLSGDKLGIKHYFNIARNCFWKSLIWPNTWRRIL